MSPTSYRTAPPRDVDIIIRYDNGEVKQIVRSNFPSGLLPGGIIAFPPPVWYCGVMRFLAASFLLLTLSTATIIRSSVYHDEVSMWQDTIAKSPNKARPYNNLGHALKESGRVDEAGPWFERALAIKPLYPDALNNLAVVYGHRGLRNDAIVLINRCLELDPYHVPARFNLAIQYYELGLLSEAAREYEHIIRIAPDGKEAAFSRTMLVMIHQGTR
jgi:tetratricopeptide (TPR) repeat protein